ncbi:hypothetical protein GCM10010472_02760 [Pseudonocardia halophobica]|uniref:Uncharacterized protein n=1 Tax=Pseudonocardia halophobica TaxID=29401 RepID=A0A9W6NVJ8_9PSEU|nr:hypothetical protein GCM10017577_17560 [Pseudonocardia halophobica]
MRPTLAAGAARDQDDLPGYAIRHESSCFLSPTAGAGETMWRAEPHRIGGNPEKNLLIVADDEARPYRARSGGPG